MSTALLVMDMQRDFLEDGGRMPVAREHARETLHACNMLIDAAKAGGAEVVYVGNEFPASRWLGNLFRNGASVRGSEGARLDPRLRRVEGPYFAKAASDAFTNPALDVHLKSHGITRLVVAGVFAKGCVRATVAGAIRRGYVVAVASDGVGDGGSWLRSWALGRAAKSGARVDLAETLAREMGATA